MSLASFSPADIGFIQSFQDNLDRKIASSHDYGGLLTTLSRRLESFRHAGMNEGPSWGPIICVPEPRSPANDQCVVRITGPMSDDHFEVTTTSPQDASAVVRQYGPWTDQHAQS